MKKRENLRYFVKIVACLLFCGIMSGCGVRDAALVLPPEGSETGEAVNVTQTVGEEDAASGTLSQAGEPYNLICVYVCGAVNSPGVVELPEGSRADDALQAAGGFSADAKTDYVNLAAKLEDGEKLYFPTVSEAEEWEYESYAEQMGLVDINTADVAQLMTLPGIGEARAKDIIAYREEHGAFRKKEDLKNVSGIKENMYKKLEEKIVVQ